MPAKAKVFPLRLPDELRAKVDKDVERYRKSQPKFSVNDWLILAANNLLKPFQPKAARITAEDRDWAAEKLAGIIDNVAHEVSIGHASIDGVPVGPVISVEEVLPVKVSKKVNKAISKQLKPKLDAFEKAGKSKLGDGFKTKSMPDGLSNSEKMRWKREHSA